MSIFNSMIGIVFGIFMGITAISLGFGALYPPINLIAKPLVCFSIYFSNSSSAFDATERLTQNK